MNTQDAIEREDQAHMEWRDRQVWCMRCDEWIRELEPREKHPINPVCQRCQEGRLEDIEAEVDEAWDDAWVAMYRAAQEEDRLRRIRAEREP